MDSYVCFGDLRLLWGDNKTEEGERKKAIHHELLVVTRECLGIVNVNILDDLIGLEKNLTWMA